MELGDCSRTPPLAASTSTIHEPPNGAETLSTATGSCGASMIEWYRMISAYIPEGAGRVFELGSGAGFLGQYIPGLNSRRKCSCVPAFSPVLDAQPTAVFIWQFEGDSRWSTSCITFPIFPLSWWKRRGACDLAAVL